MLFLSHLRITQDFTRRLLIGRQKLSFILINHYKGVERERVLLI